VADSSGNFYGTTFLGGAFNLGTVFKLDASGMETVLYSFAGGTDGAYPSGGLNLAKTGTLYGSTIQGGSADIGTIFKLDPTGKETILHTFRGFANDGQFPVGSLLLDGSGTLYGVTRNGGTGNAGTVFRLDPHGNFQVFNKGADGAFPECTLMRDSAGNIYGTTPQGGMRNEGTAFEISFYESLSPLTNGACSQAGGRVLRPRSCR